MKFACGSRATSRQERSTAARNQCGVQPSSGTAACACGTGSLCSIVRRAHGAAANQQRNNLRAAADHRVRPRLGDGFGSGPTGPGPTDELSVHPHHRDFIVTPIADQIGPIDSVSKTEYYDLKNHFSEPQCKMTVLPLNSGKSRFDPCITDSACKNQSVVVRVWYGPFNPYIPIRSTTIGKSRVAIDPIAMHTSWRSNSDIASVTRTNQYNQDLGLIHSTNGNHLESLNEGSSIDHQVTIYLHAQNITMFPTNETCTKRCLSLEEVKAENESCAKKAELVSSSEMKAALSKLDTENGERRSRSKKMLNENLRLAEIISSWTKSPASLDKLHGAMKPSGDRSGLGYGNNDRNTPETSSTPHLDLRQSGPRPDPRLLRQTALEVLTRSARSVLHVELAGTNFRRRSAAALGEEGRGGYVLGLGF
ncbi:hypothetical protein F511_21137 [Dorcoceras hygrometricum]|uniref:Uncharacterized protein n=1 Tax=Dorcoceras hygrometricum TaxID=472368 RepID=A0A2Z7CPZ1_9LAMI|nr:hypothetical protein F511_21137 [Dorcoceras hygrometricum]